MAQRHWLDPLARRLLQATGQIPPDPRPRSSPESQAKSGSSAAPLRPETLPQNELQQNPLKQEAVERDLLALKLRHNPGLRLSSADEVRHAAALGWHLDVNRATRADWLRLPGMEPHHVDLLLRLQAGGVQLSGAEDLQRLLELPATVVADWLPLLDFRWYGEPPATPPEPRLDLNQARLPDLQALGLSPERSQRLLRERARAPFRDLADLQQRLQLPPDLVERWIGKVRFGTGPIGPVLPGGPKT
jgi:DNA uptake protein ComE-like DNA-binding protein